MTRSRNPFLWTILMLIPGVLLAISGAPSESAVLEQYCQYPPYVLQSVLPSVTILISNSQSMGKFAYGDPANNCATEATACGGFDYRMTYYGLFDSGSYYLYKTAGGGKFNFDGKKISPTGTPNLKPAGDWDGNFLNWLTTRRTDVMKKVLIGVNTKSGGADVSATAACGTVTERYKNIQDLTHAYTPFTTNQIASLPIEPNCTGAAGGTMVIGGINYNITIPKTDAPSLDGIIQKMTTKASLGLAWYDDTKNSSGAYNSQGAVVNPQTGAFAGPENFRTRLETPSQFNGMAPGTPLGEALWTIVGMYARDDTVSSTGPRYYSQKPNSYDTNIDPYLAAKGRSTASRCVKGSVIIISDGEPCQDGSLPTSYNGFNILNFADKAGSRFNCQGSTCLAPANPTSPYFPNSTTIPSSSCPAGENVGGLEDVALFAHTTDLRGPDFGTNLLGLTQNLDIYVIRAFGPDISNVLKYAAINGSFDDTLIPNGVPDEGEYAEPGTDGSAYFVADAGASIDDALQKIFVNILKRATSGTAAAVLASGEGSGANIVQAAFYPRRRFFNEVIDWSGTLQNFWYYVDPWLNYSSIREDTDKSSTSTYMPVLNLVTDSTITFEFNPVSQTTYANRFSNNSAGNALNPPTIVPFEEVKSIWESGAFLHSRTALSGLQASRTIFTALDDAVPRTHVPFEDTAATATALRSSLTAANDAEATKIIRYVRGVDDVNGDGILLYRQRTVPFPTNTVEDTNVWKLGDIINSTPKVASRVPLNTYDKTYNDQSYADYISASAYKKRGMVFVGANDGMLHAFKLGKMEFPGGSDWPYSSSDPDAPALMDRARLKNLVSDPTQPGGGPLGKEQWAFIPKNALPYLKALLDPAYCHLYYVDQTAQLFDASIGNPRTNFVPDGDRRDVQSWRTILIGGMRFGGGCGLVAANAVPLPATGLGYSSYFAIDVTDPEDPIVLWEFSHPDLGFSTTGPAVVRMNATSTETGSRDSNMNGKWFVVFGSGPTGPISNTQFMGRSDQDLKLFVVDLKTGKGPSSGPPTIIRPKYASGSYITNAFAGSMINSTVDFDQDYQDDGLYLGYVRRAGTNAGNYAWDQGGVLRLQMRGDLNPANWISSTVYEDAGPITSSVATLQNKTTQDAWLFFGSGRYYFALPDTKDDPSNPRYLYGVKETCKFDCGASGATPQIVPANVVLITDALNAPGTAGWKILLDGESAPQYQAERVITDPLAASSGNVYFTTFRPYGDDCTIGGKTFLWAVKYNTGGYPGSLKGTALMQVSTGQIAQLDLSQAFTDSSTNRGGRRSAAIEGVPPTAQGLSLLSFPPPVKRILHMKER